MLWGKVGGKGGAWPGSDWAVFWARESAASDKTAANATIRIDFMV
jgi:hypothetical protein